MEESPSGIQPLSPSTIVARGLEYMSMKHSRTLKQCNDRNQLNVVTARARARERDSVER